MSCPDCPAPLRVAGHAITEHATADGPDPSDPPPDERAVRAADHGHNDSVAQPHTGAEGEPLIDAEAAAARARTTEYPLGKPGRRFNWRSPFMIGMTGAAGVALTYGAIQAVIAASQVLVLITVALFLAIGMEPAVSWLTGPWFPRWAAVATVFLVGIGLFAAFLAAAIPPLMTQGGALVHDAPQYMDNLAKRHPRNRAAVTRRAVVHAGDRDSRRHRPPG